jgi:Txe/YoeB family toxin of toxin-antitoxin system
MDLKAVFTKSFERDVKFWEKNNRKILKKIKLLVDEILHDPFGGGGHPHAYRSIAKCYSRQIIGGNRITYTVDAGLVKFIACRDHYKNL